MMSYYAYNFCSLNSPATDADA